MRNGEQRDLNKKKNDEHKLKEEIDRAETSV